MLSSPDDQLKKRLSNVYWIGGGSGAGKSTVAKLLARQHNAFLLDTDAAMQRHIQQCHAKECPQLHEFLGMSMDERWLNRTPETMLKSFHWHRGEGFEFIIDYLLALPADQIVFVEGFRLLPNLVLPRLHSKFRAVWLLPTGKFREMAFKSRGALWEIPNKTSNPQKSLENLLKRDSLFTEVIRKQVAENGLNWIDVDSETSVEGLHLRLLELFRI